MTKIQQTAGPTCSVPTACPRDELAPLLAHLARGCGTQEPRSFPRGTLLPDGRLDLCKQSLGPDHTAAVTQALKGNAFVRSLLLGADFIGDSGAEAVARYIESAGPLDTVFLGCNGISHRGLTALTEAIAAGSGVQGLWLKRNPLGPKGARALVTWLSNDDRVSTLDLHATDLGPEGLAQLAALARSGKIKLKRLYIGGQGWGPREAHNLAALIDGIALEAFFVGPDPLGDEGLAILAPAIRASTTLRELGLRTIGMTRASAELLGDLLRDHPSLERLDLERAPSAGLYTIPDNRIEDSGAAAIAQALGSKIELLDLLVSGNGLGPAGAMALINALPACPSLIRLRVGKQVPRPIRKLLRERLAAQNKGRQLPVDPAVASVRSVYRTARGPRTGRRPAETPPTPPPPTPQVPPLPNPQDIAQAVATLEALAGTPSAFFEHRQALQGLRAASNRVVAAIIDESRRRKSQQKRKRTTSGPTIDKTLDRTLAATSLIRTRRNETIESAELGPPSNYSRRRPCYICKSRYRSKHAFYDALCPECAATNWHRRTRTADLHGHRALVTGGRIKIGYHTALRLLLCGAEVWITTRFPRDAARRFATHQSFAEFRDRLHIVGLDFRDCAGVEAFTHGFDRALGHIDILVNNAALTIHRPPAYYAHVAAGEKMALQGELAALITPLRPPALVGDPGRPALAPVPAQATLFPTGQYDLDGEPLDRRSHNSWSARLEDVSLQEFFEVQAVSNFAPFILTRGLAPTLRRSPHRHRHVINVSAMEGNFARAYKSDRHPHTNMAKASLNMLTRTLGTAWAAERIYVNSIDTGWVTDEQPIPWQETERQTSGFAPPLDVIDGAARVCDPIISAALGEAIPVGAFVKDYSVHPW